VKLNIGSGEVRFDGYLNVDVRDDCGADIVADAGQIPLPSESIEHIKAHDIYEHVPKDQAALLLAEWWRLLIVGGTLELRCPNLHALAVQLSYWHDKPSPQLNDLLNNIYGGHRFGPDGCWDQHHYGYSPTTLALNLEVAGFEVLSNDEAINMTVIAVKR